jgi:hypothetical protein
MNRNHKSTTQTSLDLKWSAIPGSAQRATRAIPLDATRALQRSVTLTLPQGVLLGATPVPSLTAKSLLPLAAALATLLAITTPAAAMENVATGRWITRDPLDYRANEVLGNPHATSTLEVAEYIADTRNARPTSSFFEFETSSPTRLVDPTGLEGNPCPVSAQLCVLSCQAGEHPHIPQLACDSPTWDGCEDECQQVNLHQCRCSCNCQVGMDPPCTRLEYADQQLDECIRCRRR